MTTIGQFRRDGDRFVGRVTTLQMDTTVRLDPIEKRSPRAPEYRAFVGETECGAAWRPKDTASGVLLNLRLDDPAWPEPIDARLMAGEDAFALVWFRRTETTDRDREREEARPREPDGRSHGDDRDASPDAAARPSQDR